LARKTSREVRKPAGLTVVILAAGLGKRMKSDLPKVLHPLAGRPLLKHVIDTARSLTPAAIHVVYGHGGERVCEALPDEPVSWVLQAHQLGTGHAVSDTLALLTMQLEDPTGYGRIVRNARGQVQRIVEEKDAGKRELAVRECNSGIMAVPVRHLRKWLTRLKNDNSQREYYLTDVIAMAVKDGVRVAPLVAPTTIEVLGVNDKAQLAEVETAYRGMRARELMLDGVTIVDPARFDVRGTLTAGRDVVIDVNVVFEGQVTLGDGVRIGPNCVVRDTSIGAGTQVFPNCVIDRAVIGPDCNIGPFARFRPSSVLERAVHIGNFVEVKNTRVGEGSKSNHLTYLGDAIVGKGVNVGAGTVTCNYDGANKWQTHIDDGAFIGSGSMLVAPVRIGANATIGAGSTITKDAPAGELTLERSKQMSVEGWQRPKKVPKT
jgi:bifunctional UDP-N-acetylglucosamine pyrophosphorylase / glucosamine-1-phosphate N-acetyltransferase